MSGSNYEPFLINPDIKPDKTMTKWPIWLSLTIVLIIVVVVVAVASYVCIEVGLNKKLTTGWGWGTFGGLMVLLVAYIILFIVVIITMNHIIREKLVGLATRTGDKVAAGYAAVTKLISSDPVNKCSKKTLEALNKVTEADNCLKGLENNEKNKVKQYLQENNVSEETINRLFS